MKGLNTGHAKIMPSPGVISKESPHYVTHGLEHGSFDIAILRFGVNYLLQKRNQSQAVDELILNLKKTAIKCMSFGVFNMWYFFR